MYPLGMETTEPFIAWHQSQYYLRLATHYPLALPLYDALDALSMAGARTFWTLAAESAYRKPRKLNKIIAHWDDDPAKNRRACRKMLERDPYLLCPHDCRLLVDQLRKDVQYHLAHCNYPIDGRANVVQKIQSRYNLDAGETQIVVFLWLSSSQDWCARLFNAFADPLVAIHAVTGLDQSRVRTLLREDAPLQEGKIVLPGFKLSMSLWRELEVGE